MGAYVIESPAYILTSYRMSQHFGPLVESLCLFSKSIRQQVALYRHQKSFKSMGADFLPTFKTVTDYESNLTGPNPS